MSIAGAADRTNGDVRNASAQARFDHAARHALNDNLETLFRWRDILRRLAITFEAADAAVRRANSGATTLQVELVASSLTREAELYRAIADETGLAFQEAIDPRRISLGGADPIAVLASQSRACMVKYGTEDGENCFLVVPEHVELDDFRALVRRYPDARHRIRVASPSTIRVALVARAQPHLIRQGRDSLFLRFPELSARTVGNAWQGVIIGGGAVAIVAAAAVWPWQTLLAAHMLFSLFFLSCIGLRLAAAFSMPRQPAAPELDPDAALPSATILVALRNEAEIVPDLLIALGRVVWPRAKLEIKLICEADDAATLGALRTQQLRPWIEVIEVPPGMPRTKPNALSYALPLTRGEIVTLYDAEDRPHPFQLLEAWRHLRDGDDTLACVQAPLDVDNAEDGLLPHAFQVEYAALFRGLLPWLSRHRQMFPLGGTSNHFRRRALEHVLAWDPYNVTEDADLGVRLARFGYRTETITLPTREDAPDTPMVWLRQRTRWFKGWAQTWLVHMRNPARLLHEIGPGAFVLVQILFAGMLISSLLHPMALVTGIGLAAYSLASALHPLQLALLVLDTANIALGYGSFLLLGWRSLPPGRRKAFWKPALFLPVYWLMMTAAAWRAVYQLWRQPHLWEKTPHKRHRPPPERPRPIVQTFRRAASPAQR